jgi:hypothetical protein
MDEAVNDGFSGPLARPRHCASLLTIGHDLPLRVDARRMRMN